MRNLARKYAQRLTQPGMKEGIRQSLYDFQTYTQLGLVQLTFFQTPNGSGGKTLADTNMSLAGQIPQGWKFIAESLEIYIFPGSTGGGVYTVQSPVKAAAAGAAPNFANDVWALAQSGWLAITIGSKPYLTEAPLMRFPPKTGILMNPAVAGTFAATNVITMDYARLGGRAYAFDPELPLPPNTNFDITIRWPALVPTPSTFAARIGIVLDGLLFRD